MNEIILDPSINHTNLDSTKLFISNKAFDHQDHASFLLPGVGLNSSERWLYQLKTIQDENDKFRFFTETGLYFCLIEKPGFFPKRFILNVKKSDGFLQINFKSKLINKIRVKTINLWDMKVTSHVRVEVYKDNQIIQSSTSDENGVVEFDLEMMTNYLFITCKEGFIKLSQFYLISTSSIVDGISIKMIPKNKNLSEKPTTELFIIYEGEPLIEFRVVCPGIIELLCSISIDYSHLSHKHNFSTTYNILYQDLMLKGNTTVLITFGPQNRIVNYDLLAYSLASIRGLFEIVAIKSNQFDSEMAAFDPKGCYPEESSIHMHQTPISYKKINRSRGSIQMSSLKIHPDQSTSKISINDSQQVRFKKN